MDPKSTAGYQRKAEVLAKLKRYDAALAAVDKIIELDPKSAVAYRRKGEVLAKLKKFDEALAALDKAAALAPDDLAPLLEKARIDGFQGNMKAALGELDKATAAAPDNLTVLLLRAGVLEELGQKEKALTDVNLVLDLKPDVPEALRLRAALLADAKRFDDALADLEKLRQQDPKDDLTLLQIGAVYQNQKKFDKAIEIYSAVIGQEGPRQWLFLRGRGDAFLSTGKRGEAIADFEKAAAQHPKDVTSLNNLAWLLATAPEDKLRDGKRAVTLATQACELTEYKEDYILSTLAAAYAETGDFDNAQKWSGKAVELGKNSEHAAALKKELASYQARKPWREALPEAEAKTEPKKEEPKAK